MDWVPPSAGKFIVIAVAVDSKGATSYDYRIVHAFTRSAGIPPSPRIVSPAQGDVFVVGESLSLEGEVFDPDSSDGNVTWLVSDGRRFTGAEIGSVTFNRPGRYEISMIASDAKSRRTTSVTVYVVDSSSTAMVEITQPPTDIRLQPGESLYLEGGAKNGSLFDKHFSWVITSLTNKSVYQVLHLSNPGGIVLPDGDYQITLSAVHPRFENLRFQSEPRYVRVASSNDEFVNNNALQDAATIRPGNYPNQILAADEYYAFDVRAGQTIDVFGKTQIGKTDEEDSLVMQLFGPDQQPIRDLKTSTSQSLRHVANQSGKHYLSAHLQSGSGYKTISFGFGVQVLNPALYFPDIQWNQNVGSRMVVVNPFDEDAALEVVGYTRDGELVETVSMELVAKGRLSLLVDQVFGDQSSLVSWVRVDSNLGLNGICITETHDGFESYAVNGSPNLSSELYVPHVAQQTTQWYTRGIVANGEPKITNSMLQSEGPQMLLDFHSPFSKIDFDFVELFGGSLPTGVEWGTFIENESEMKLAAVEVFGKKDGSRQVAGLSLGDARQDNPNFFYIKQNLYFTHIARDTAQFWTGIAIVNIGTARRSFIAKAYGSSGTVLGQKIMSLGPSEKIVQLAEDFLDGVADITMVDWLLIEADPGLVGYELFGTLDNKRLAGLEPGAGLKSAICMPFIDVNSGYWYGVSIVNAGDSSTNVTFKLYDSGGNVLDEKSANIGAKQKYLALLTDLFGTLPENSAWVDCSSEAGQLTGFELFGDPTFEKMAAILSR